MRRDLATLPLWYAEPGDWVLCETVPETTAYAFLPSSLRPQAMAVTPQNIPLESSSPVSWKAQPWGLSPDSLRHLAQWAEKQGLHIQGITWQPVYRRLTGRQTAADCLAHLRTLLSGYPLPSSPVFCSSLEEVRAALSSLSSPCLLKTPYSSSGRGLLWCQGQIGAKEEAWVEGALRKQGMISVEQGLDKVLDFAMEFHVGEAGEVRYEGLSLFQTAERGAYTGNRLAEEPLLRKLITDQVGESLFEQVRQAWTQVLANVYSPSYQGYIGVDMLLYRGFDGQLAWHPCVEVNMRATMGWVALRLTQRLLAKGATGIFCVDYQKEDGAAYRLHQEAMRAHPLCYVHGRIAQGYLSLCPVNPSTHYRAYLLLS